VDSPAIGAALVRLRQAKRWSRRTLARRTGVTPEYLIALEAGELALDPAVGEVLVRAFAATTPAMAALVFLCMATFEAELDRRRAVALAPHLPVAGHA
jgi:transcriptional regulator with XRE-family HTH domain